MDRLTEAYVRKLLMSGQCQVLCGVRIEEELLAGPMEDGCRQWGHPEGLWVWSPGMECH